MEETISIWQCFSSSRQMIAKQLSNLLHPHYVISLEQLKGFLDMLKRSLFKVKSDTAGTANTFCVWSSRAQLINLRFVWHSSNESQVNLIIFGFSLILDTVMVIYSTLNWHKFVFDNNSCSNKGRKCFPLTFPLL